MYHLVNNLKDYSYLCKQVSANRRDARLLWHDKNKASAEALV